ncbi:MAG: hypothetical protein KDC98_09515 [Planctomycetes bacterium]|nr:hypothetical protein [Planctomycetota bacterium]
MRPSLMRPRRWFALGLTLLLAGCAWTRRENRPVWNAFEGSMVPESEGAFYAALPLTVPIGLGAILIDTLVAHPVQVIDDAWDDACNIWRSVDITADYYTESMLLPFRTVGSPVVFGLSFLGRSLFDLPTAAVEAQRREDAAEQARLRTLRWLEKVASGAPVTGYHRPQSAFDAELKAALAQALAHGSAAGRIAVYEAMTHHDEPALIDWDAALADPSAVVRHRVMGSLPAAAVIAPATQQRLLADPDEAVRELARLRWGQ